ncbi:hypothetical protein Tco_0408656 [Tanacetum coccineum]
MDNSKRGHIPMQERLDLNKSHGAQNITSRFQQNPGELHWTAVKNILKVEVGMLDGLNNGVCGVIKDTEIGARCGCLHEDAE